MCTAISYKNKYAYFGRNLDIERGYNEKVVITPRNYEFKMRFEPSVKSHYAMIGMALVIDNIPLYFEATNEKGLSIAALNFPQNAVYHNLSNEKYNIAPFELIPCILAGCANIREAKELLYKLNLVKINFNEQLTLTPLHWMISDKNCSITVESLKDGLKIYDNPFEVLTNNPPFDFHRINMSNYCALSTGALKSCFREDLPMSNYSLGMGALGLPGDYSSVSRFIRAFFVKENAVCNSDESSCVNQFFHILGAVEMPKGCVLSDNGYEYNHYSSCCNTDKGIYYYKTYNDFQIKRISMQDFDLDGKELNIQ